MAEATGVGGQVRFTPSESMPKMAAREDVNVRIPRYVFNLGDFIPDVQKASYGSRGGWIGGYHIGTDFPTMWRTNFFCIRGGITPLEVRAVKATADSELMRRPEFQVFGAEMGSAPVPRYEVFPGHDIAGLISDEYRPYGFVEITGLRGAEWDDNAPLQLQMYYFPEWIEYLDGATAAPTLLEDWEALIRQGISTAPNEVIAQAGHEMLESGRLFRQYAEQIIGINRELVAKGANDAGYSVGWQPMTRLFAKQLGIELEPEARVRSIAEGQVEAQKSTNENITKIAEALKQDREELKEDRALQTKILETLTSLVAQQATITPQEMEKTLTQVGEEAKSHLPLEESED